MLKIKELLKSLIETQNQINESLKGLQEDLKSKLDKIRITADKLDTCSFTVNRLDSYIESNVYTKDATIEAINKEYDYRKEYERCSKENDDRHKLFKQKEQALECIDNGEWVNSEDCLDQVCDILRCDGDEDE